MKATILKTLTLIFAGATLALASLAHAADKLPDFVNKVQLWNCWCGTRAVRSITTLTGI